MKLLKIFALIAFLLPLSVFAENYTLSGSWQDPTPANGGYTPVYNVEWRVTPTGTVTQINDLASPSFSTSVIAAPADEVQVRFQNKNSQGNILGPFSTWINATASFPPVTPLAPANMTIQLILVP